VRAVDTDVLVSVLTGDEPSQAAAARSLFSSKIYSFSQNAVSQSRSLLLGSPSITVEDRESVRSALDLVTPPGSTFHTFDQTLVRRANAPE